MSQRLSCSHLRYLLPIPFFLPLVERRFLLFCCCASVSRLRHSFFSLRVIAYSCRRSSVARGNNWILFLLFSHGLEVSLISIKSIINNVFEHALRIGKQLVINMCETHTLRVVARSDDSSPLGQRCSSGRKAK